MIKVIFLASFIFMNFNANALPVGGISKFFKNIFSKGDEMIDLGSNTSKQSNEFMTISEDVITSKTYQGKPFEDILEEISAMNAEPIEGLKNYFNPAENSAVAMTDSDYSFKINKNINIFFIYK